MSKKQFEHIEDQFRDAAENFQPPVNNDAWEKMDSLLDREFNKERRRPLFWVWASLLICILTGTGIYLLTIKKTDQLADKTAQTKIIQPSGNEKGSAIIPGTKAHPAVNGSSKGTTNAPLNTTDKVEDQVQNSNPSPALNSNKADKPSITATTNA